MQLVAIVVSLIVSVIAVALTGRAVIAMLDPNPKVAGRGIVLLRERGVAVDVVGAGRSWRRRTSPCAAVFRCAWTMLVGTGVVSTVVLRAGGGAGVHLGELLEIPEQLLERRHVERAVASQERPGRVAMALVGRKAAAAVRHGIARALEHSALTEAGIVFGTPGYLSPEQVVGQQITTQSDVFALGSVLVYAATGGGPFGEGATSALVYRVVHQEPDLSRVPPGLVPLIVPCLVREPANRPTPARLLEAIGPPSNDPSWLPERVRTMVEQRHTELGRLPAKPPTRVMVDDPPPRTPTLVAPAPTPPAAPVRILNHWDNLDGTVERGYAGSSLWDWHKLPDSLDPRYTDYARANASLGINGTVLNNVNSNALSLTPMYLEKTAALAGVLRPYGIRVFLSARFSAPIEIGGLKTADPLDPAVQRWWREKTDEIYKTIPDFGGFLVKYSRMPSYMQAVSWFSLMKYAFEGLMVTVYGFDRCEYTTPFGFPVVPEV